MLPADASNPEQADRATRDLTGRIGDARDRRGRRVRAGLTRSWLAAPSFSVTCIALATVSGQSPARAERVENQVAVFAALDKVTARISKFEVPLGQTIKFGALKVTPRVCYSRPGTEQPKTTSFVEVDETMLDGSEKRIFNGWMFAESPGLNAVEHPVFDVWLTDCQKPAKTAAAPKPADGSQPGKDAGQAAPGAEEAPAEPRRRVRR